MGHGADQRCWGCGARRAGQPPWYSCSVSRPRTGNRRPRIPAAFAADATRYLGQLHRARGAGVDFRAGHDGARWSALWEEFHSDWRELWFNQRVEPPSWVLADEAMAAGAKGILFVSKLAPSGLNLVIYNDILTTDDTLQVYDPTEALPKNQDSWR